MKLTRLIPFDYDVGQEGVIDLPVEGRVVAFLMAGRQVGMIHTPGGGVHMPFQPLLRVLCDPTYPLVPRRFIALPSGHLVPDRAIWLAFRAGMGPDGPFELDLFEIPPGVSVPEPTMKKEAVHG